MPGRLIGVRLSPDDETALEEVRRIFRLEGIEVDGDADALRTLLRQQTKPARPSEMPVFAGLLKERSGGRRRPSRRKRPDIDESLYGRRSKQAKHLRRGK